MKAHLGWWCADALELSRRTLGGHAFSAYTAVAGVIGDYSVITTGGGDNTVLAQQCARYLIASFKRAREGKSLGASVRYLQDQDQILSRTSSFDFPTPRCRWRLPPQFAVELRVAQPSDLLKTDVQMDALLYLSTKMIMTAGTTLATALSNGASMGDAWNSHMMEMIECTKPHCWVLVMRHFARKVELSRQSPTIYPVLKRLLDLFALYQIQKMSDYFLENKYFDADTLRLIRKTVLQLCREIRPDSVSLVDAFNYPDWIVKSPLGRYDGNIYEAYFELVNKENPVGRPPYWEADVKPLTARL